MSKQDKEKQVVKTMIILYCKKIHKCKSLCNECNEVLNYANIRIEHCPFKETKTFCSNCEIHCYKPEMREKIRKIMRFSGPRMILYHPIMAIKHLIQTKKEKKE